MSELPNCHTPAYSSYAEQVLANSNICTHQDLGYNCDTMNALQLKFPRNREMYSAVISVETS